MGTALTPEQFHRLDQRIRILSTFLWKIPVIEATGHSERGRSANICQHLANVFSTFNPGQKDEVVAVTGMQTPEAALSTILLTRNPTRSKEAETRSLVVQELQPSKAEVGVILRDRSAHTFRSHIQDWMKITSERSTNGNEDYKYELAEFTVYRNRLRIAQRLENGGRIWKTHPILPLSQFLDKPLPPGTKKLLESIDFPINVTSADIQDVGHLENMNLKEETGSSSWENIPFNAETAIHWLRILVRTYQTFEDLFKYLGLDNPRRLPEKGDSWDNDHFFQCITLLGAMRDLLSIQLPDSGKKLYSVLLNAISSWEPPLLNKEHYIFQPAPLPKLEISEDDMEVDQAEQVPDAAVGDAIDVLGKPEDSDPPGEQVFRYLRTIPAHLTSARVVMERLGRQIPPPRVNLLEYPKPNPDLETVCVDEIIEEVLQDFVGPGKDLARDFLQKRRKAGGRLKEGDFKGTVHAEAALMGLAVSKYMRCRPDPESLDPFQLLPDPGSTVLQLLDDCLPEMGQVPIGVAKNCCSTCVFFHRSIESHVFDPAEMDTPDRASPIHFDLPGSHGLSFPWALPEIGVTKEVGEALEQELMKQLIKFVRTNLESMPAGRQSSEGSGDDEAERPKEEVKRRQAFKKPLPVLRRS